MSDINGTLLVKTLVFTSILICALLSAQAQAGSCKVDLFRLTEVEVRKPAKALDETGTKVLSTLISTAITAGAGKVALAGLTKASSSYRIASQAGKPGFVVGNKVISKAADKAIDFGISELINYVDDTVRTPDDLMVRVGGRIAVANTSMPDPTGIFDTISPNYEGSFIGSFNLQLIEYDSGSANDDLGTIYGEDQNLLAGQLPPLNQESLEIFSSAEDGSEYRVAYEIISGAGNLDDIPERLFCNTDECIDARENFPKDPYPLGFPQLSGMKECPQGYKDAGGSYHGDGVSGNGPWYRVCELHPNCGRPFKRLKDIPGGVAALKDGDIIVLRGRTSFRQAINGPNSTEQDYDPDAWYRYLSNSNRNGQYLGVCTDCTGAPNAGLYYIDRDKSAAQWTVKKLDNGKIALRGSNGKYLTRCQGCTANGRQDAFVHVTDQDFGGYAEFTIQESPNPSGDFIYTLQSDLGGYLSGCLGCINPHKLGYGYSATFDSRDPSGHFSKWSIGVQQKDWDSDKDGWVNIDDAFPSDSTEYLDTDGDGVGDNKDVFPNDASETKDTDGDGFGDNKDAFPSDKTEHLDTDGDGVGDRADLDPNNPDVSLDSDGDGIPDYYDPCPGPLNIDTDIDKVCDDVDAFPTDPSESADTDGDGVGDNKDVFDNDPSETEDTDYDGLGNNSDPYPYDIQNRIHIEVDNSNGWAIERAAIEPVYYVDPPDGFTLPAFLAAFELTGGVSGSTAKVTFIYPEAFDSELVWLVVGGLSPFYITNNSLTIDGNRVTVTIQDGGVSDEDFYADGVITNNNFSGPAILAGTVDLLAYDTIKKDWDSDGDGVFDKVDAFPYDANQATLGSGGGGALNIWYLFLLWSITLLKLKKVRGKLL